MRELLDVKPYFSQPIATQDMLISEKMLIGKWRNYVIEKAKDPLRIALEKSGSFWSYIVLFFIILRTANRLRKNIGKVTKENTIFSLTHLLIDKKELFSKMHHNPCRDKMFEAG